MRVLMIEFFYPYNTYTLELGEALSAHADLTMICRHGVTVPKDAVHWKDYLYEGGCGRVKGLFRYAGSLLKVRHEIISGHYDVVHVQFFRKDRLEMFMYRRLKKYSGRLFYTVHDVLPHEAVASDRKLYGSFYAQCDGLIVHNEESRRLLVEDYHLPTEKIFTMPMGSYPAAQAARRVPQPGEKVRFLQFGQIRRYKGIDIVIKALALLPPEVRARVEVSVVGKQYTDMDSTDYVGMARSLGVSDCITFNREHIPDSEIPDLFNRADICLVPYRELYGSASLMMAYSYEKPVIATDLPILREETDGGKTGLLFENENPQALADAMQAMTGWTEADYDARRAEIRRLVTDRYNWTKSALKLFRSYEAILKGRSGHGAE